MLKKSLIAGGIVAVLLGLVFGLDAFSYVSTFWGETKEAVRNNVPIEFELKRARDLARDLAPVIDECKHRIAEEEIEVGRLEKRLAELEKRQDTEQAELMTLRHDLSTGNEIFTYAGRQYSAKEVKVDMARRFERYKTNDERLASLRKMYETRRNALAATRQKLDNMLAAKQQLELDIANLQARLELVRASQAVNEYTIDDSKLSRVKDLVQDLETRIEVMAKLADEQSDAYPEIPVGKDAASEDIVEQINAYFNKDAKTIVLDSTK
jgi:chromosome segregation ATPase